MPLKTPSDSLKNIESNESFVLSPLFSLKMAIGKHKIRTKNGFRIVKNLTPLKSIRLNCLECVGWMPSEVKICEIVLCPMHSFRMGKSGNTRQKKTAPGSTESE